MNKNPSVQRQFAVLGFKPEEIQVSTRPVTVDRDLRSCYWRHGLMRKVDGKVYVQVQKDMHSPIVWHPVIDSEYTCELCGWKPDKKTAIGHVATIEAQVNFHREAHRLAGELRADA